MRLIFILALMMFLSACVGVGAIVPTKKEFPVGTCYYGQHEDEKKIDIERRLTHKNKQPEVSHVGGREVWTYRSEKEWCGALFVILPLMLPVCESSYTYYFEGETLVMGERRTTDYYGFMCSMFPVCPDGNNCKACWYAF